MNRSGDFLKASLTRLEYIFKRNRLCPRLLGVVLVSFVLFFTCGAGTIEAQQPAAETIFGERGVNIWGRCNVAEKDSYDFGSCMAYIAGIIDGSTVMGHGSSKPYLVCIPHDVTLGQLALVVKKYGDDHPENLHWPAVRFVNTALRAAFPCHGL